MKKSFEKFLLLILLLDRKFVQWRYHSWFFIVTDRSCWEHCSCSAGPPIVLYSYSYSFRLYLDYWLPFVGVGILAPIPFGFIIGPFVAYLEEKDDLTKAFIIALGALAGFLSGTILKLAVSLFLAYEYINRLGFIEWIKFVFLQFLT